MSREGAREVAERSRVADLPLFWGTRPLSSSEADWRISGKLWQFMIYMYYNCVWKSSLTNFQGLYRRKRGGTIETNKREGRKMTEESG